MDETGQETTLRRARTYELRAETAKTDSERIEWMNGAIAAILAHLEEAGAASTSKGSSAPTTGLATKPYESLSVSPLIALGSSALTEKTMAYFKSIGFTPLACRVNFHGSSTLELTLTWDIASTSTPDEVGALGPVRPSVRDEG